MCLARGKKFLYQTIQSVVRAELAQVSSFWDQEFFAFCKSSSHHSNGWVPTSIAKVFFQETPARYRTLAACQNEYLPQVSRWVEGCWVWERAAVSSTAHSIHTCDWHSHAQGRTSNLQDQASWCVTPQYAYLIPWEQQGIPCAHCCGPPCHQSEGLPKKCRVLAKAVVKWSEALKNLQEATGSWEIVSTSVDVTARKVEIEQTQQMLQEAQKAHDKAIAVLYEQLRNLLSGDAQFQWDCVCCKMHERDSWAAVNGQVTKGRHPQTWTSFLDCLELHKLTVFSADAAKRQWFYTQQAVRKLQRATVQQHILHMGVLNDYVKHLPTLKDSSKAVPTTKKGNIPFWQGWSSCHSAVLCPAVVAEPVQPQPLNCCWVNSYIATRPRGHRASHGWEERREPQGKRKG